MQEVKGGVGQTAPLVPSGPMLLSQMVKLRKSWELKRSGKGVDTPCKRKAELAPYPAAPCTPRLPAF